MTEIDPSLLYEKQENRVRCRASQYYTSASRNITSKELVKLNVENSALFIRTRCTSNSALFNRTEEYLKN